MNKNRLKYLDWARGFAMVLVMYAHFFNVKTAPLRIWIYSFHVPIFFIITGILNRKYQSKFDVKRQFKNLMIPYFVFCLITTVGLMGLDFISGGSWIYNGKNNLKKTLLFLGVNANWFLPCLFLGLIIFNVLKKNVKKKKYMILCAGVLLLVPFIKINMVNVATYRVVCRSLIATSFLIIGYYLSDIIDKIDIKKYKIASLLLISIIYSTLLGYIDLYSLKLVDPFLYVLCAISGSMFCLLLFKYVEQKDLKIIGLRLLEFIGKNSLIFLGTHMVVGKAVKQIFKIMFKTEYIVSNLYLNGFIIFVIVLVIEIVGIVLYNKIKKRFIGGCSYGREKNKSIDNSTSL